MSNKVATIRNGAKVDDLMATVEAIKAKPSLAKFGFRSHSRWISRAHTQGTFDSLYGAGEEHKPTTPLFMEGDEPAALLGTGLAAGGLCGLLANLLLAWFYITVQASQVVAGIIFNLLAYAVASYTYRVLLGHSGGTLQVPMFEPVHLPRLAALPWVGLLLFQQTVPFYGVVLLTVAAYWVLFRTGFGLSLRAVGENPRAADATGIPVLRVRYLAVLIGGTAAGLAGAYLVLGRIGLFRDTIVAGQGFIALAVVIFGRWHPFKAALAALAFGLADALQLSLQLFHAGIPAELFIALPYLMTLLAISGIFGKARQPAALLAPYQRD